jgi:hypothetical protein
MEERWKDFSSSYTIRSLIDANIERRKKRAVEILVKTSKEVFNPSFLTFSHLYRNDKESLFFNEFVKKRSSTKNPAKVSFPINCEISPSDPRFTGGVYTLDTLSDLKVSLVIKLNDNHFSFENQVHPRNTPY